MAKKRRANGQGTLFKRSDRGPWIAAWFDHDGKRRERSTRTSDKAAAERILAKRCADAALRREGVIDPRAEGVSRQAQRPIEEHLGEWRSALEAKANSPKRVAVACRRALRIITECRFTTLADVDAGRVNSFMQRLRDEDAAPRTINGYLQALRQFLRWAVAESRLGANPLASVGTVRVVGQTRNRRPLAVDELARLIEAAECGPTYRGLNGADRAMLYRLATGTGFRAAELASLTPASFDLDADPPAVTVKAAYSKRRRDDRQPIRPDLADLLRPWLALRPPSGPLLDLPDKLPPMLRADLRRARAWWIKAVGDRAGRRERRGSDFLRDRDRDGRLVDFHALRATFITLLVKSGASVKEAQELARHSDPKLTLNTYTRLGVHDLAGALARLPAATPDRPELDALRATGTDGAAAPTTSSTASSRSANRCDRVRRSAGGADANPISLDARNPLRCAEKDDTAPCGAASGDQATPEIRTRDLCFTKAPLYRLS